jgi:SAM-dependent methyltransferase
MTERSPVEWRKDSQSFDTVAEDYDAFRPGYPAELVDCLVELTGLAPGSPVLEIGSGTGIATLLFARRGCQVLGLEPGSNLAAIAAHNLSDYPLVKFELCRFEDWRETPAAFDVVTSAQAFHWIPPEIGYAKAARALKPGGYLALFWNMYPGMTGPLKDELDQVYAEFFPEAMEPIPMEVAIQERSAAIEASGYFGPVTVRRFPWSMCYTTQQHLGLLNTYSDHLALPTERRQQLFRAVGETIDRHGGTIERPYVAVLFVAQKTVP